LLAPLSVKVCYMISVLFITGLGSEMFFPETQCDYGCVPPQKRGIAAGVRTMNYAGNDISITLPMAIKENR